MSEVSLLHKLEQQKEKNQEAYQSLFNSLNLSRLDRYDQLSETIQTDYQTLRQAGFAPESIVDDLGKTSLKLLIHFGKKNQRNYTWKMILKLLPKLMDLNFSGLHILKVSTKNLSLMI
ncbi:hypothetical protein OKW21_003027 [Catalinimonas alkaloidigena]|uniref:hypothetical protein n=1 Tax=Catalinimonas alkaloidigena TaxID=1075417 RepID=UPI0024057EF5|nr:hypothetical protein [Catalinimonas alkaloidigena]MDF9797764.1 hypothetical protein [Catalinimonas alkaloidigena]